MASSTGRKEAAFDGAREITRIKGVMYSFHDLKLKTFVLFMSAAMMMAGCAQKENRAQEEKGVSAVSQALTPEEKTAGTFTPEIMWKMGRVANSTVSPSGQVACTVTYYQLSENRGTTKLYVQSSAGEKPRRLTDDDGNEGNLQWNRDGSKLYFLSDRSGDNQLWSVRPDGSDLTQHSFVDGGVDGFGVAPDERNVFYTKSVPVEKRRSAEVYADMDKSKAKIYDDLMARHWNYWDEGSYSHIFVAPVTDGKAGEGKDILDGEPWDAPLAPYFDLAEIAWNHAGTQLAYTCKKQTGTEYAVSTDSDIFIYELESGRTRNICKDGEPVDARSETLSGMGGYDRYPVWSPDDKKIAFRSMRRPGNEADKERLFVWYSENGSMKDLSAAFDYNAENVVWNGNEELFFIAAIEGTHQVCKADEAGTVTVLTRGDHDVNAFTTNGSRMIAEVTRHATATELYDIPVYASADATITPFSHINQEIYDHIPMGKTEKRWVTTSDGKQMLTWVIFPPDFDPARTYPTLLYCQGGPQSVVSQFWSYRWNFQLMAAKGYIIVAPNRRGTPSFGQAWVDQISGDYSGQNIRDYLSAIDDVAGEPWCDANRLGCVGASYGGYSAFFLAGNHDNRFKAFIAHCGIFDFDSMYGSTEELWFVNADYKGAYWDDNATARRSYANSPHKFVARWDTPILIFTGLNDYRIPYTQSLEAFTAARLRNIPSRLVVFEDEGHQVFKPQNSIVWNREFFGWLEKYLK